MRSAFTFVLALLSVLSAGVAHADPYTVLPNGSVVFNTVMTSSGSFTCVRSVPCSGSGTNSITIGSGTNTATMTFTGVSSSFQVGNVARRVSLGTFEVTASDGFLFPTLENPRRGILRFDLSMTHTSPVEATRRKSILFGPGGEPNLRLLQTNNNSMIFPAGLNPPGAHYTALVYSFSPFPFSISGRGTTDLSAKVGAVPEPSTLVLLGTGLAWGAYRRRKKQLAENC
jgi:hypothetical protein